MRLKQRSLGSEILIKGADSLEIIESYPDDKYLPSFLLRGTHGSRAFHVQVAVDVEGENVRVVTMYIPDLSEMGLRISNQEAATMKCRVCSGLLEPRVTDLPFKIGDSSIVVLKALPVLQCRQCGEIEMEDHTMRRVDQVLAGVDQSSELEVIPFAA
jgi:YgiT-type zinc finger domain-containing protein